MGNDKSIRNGTVDTGVVSQAQSARGLSRLGWSRQLLRYGLVGVGTNAGGYLIFFLLTLAGLGPSVAISVVYPIMIGTSFLLNRNWSFGSGDHWMWPAFKYFVAYAGCYGVNVAVLKIFSGSLGISSLIVQAVAVPVVALLLFVTLRYWVFRRPAEAESLEEAT